MYCSMDKQLCQKFICERILKKDKTKTCFEYFLSDEKRGYETHIWVDNKDTNSEKACSEVSKYPPLNEDPSAIIFIFIVILYFLFILLSN